MSDDEDDYYEYDEFEDDGIFWVEEADPTAADDLAAAATYDSSFPDDPSLETADLYSDWEELSDDYYDDDPTVVRRLRAIGAWPIDQPTHINAPSSKRRKGAGTLAADLASFQGVAWKHPQDETDMVEIYAPGDGEKVSLLKNWREVFRDAKPAIGRLRGRIPLLKTLDVVSSEQSESDLDVPSLVEDNFEDEMGSLDATETLPANMLPARIHSQVVVETPSREPFVHSKKGKLDELNGIMEPVIEDQETTNGATTESPAEEAKEPTATAPRRGRKRKASISVDDQLDQSGNNTGAEEQTRPKRAAMTRLSQNKTSLTAEPAPASSGPVRRSARHKK
ncbi:uncharacterized protein BDW70DRAFT_130604 [Aspergillus foveolatus]|uniref:uncharacterized protein n=1 Tax=Aspergillus foveolatus TaxID=210207 RepID=UPI003CCCEA8A